MRNPIGRAGGSPNGNWFCHLKVFCRFVQKKAGFGGFSHHACGFCTCEKNVSITKETKCFCGLKLLVQLIPGSIDFWTGKCKFLFIKDIFAGSP
jgi:hypothetical protein